MKIGNVDLGEKPLFLAPMEDVTMTTTGLRYPVLTLRRADIVAAGACAEWLADRPDLFNAVAKAVVEGIEAYVLAQEAAEKN